MYYERHQMIRSLDVGLFQHTLCYNMSRYTKSTGTFLISKETQSWKLSDCCNGIFWSLQTESCVGRNKRKENQDTPHFSVHAPFDSPLCICTRTRFKRATREEMLCCLLSITLCNSFRLWNFTGPNLIFCFIRSCVSVSVFVPFSFFFAFA